MLAKMRLTLKMAGSTKSIALSSAGLLAFQILYFIPSPYVVWPSLVTANPVLLRVSFLTWGCVGVIMALRDDYSNRHKTKLALEVFVLMIFGSFIASHFITYAIIFLAAFGGYYAGFGLIGCAILVYRAKYPNRPHLPIDYKW